MAGWAWRAGAGARTSSFAQLWPATKEHRHRHARFRRHSAGILFPRRPPAWLEDRVGNPAAPGEIGPGSANDSRT